ncbi:MAG: hypothetical protein J6T34_05970, partial [Bacilli bacterium]|nr:hypothetical protein [Bacilli bacterium]
NSADLDALRNEMTEAKLRDEIEELEKEIERNNKRIRLIRDKLNERLESQRKVEDLDEKINLYARKSEELEGYNREYQENKELLAKLNEELNGLDEENDRSQVIRIKAQIQDVKITQDNLATKIDEDTKLLRELAKDERVDYYVRLIDSMVELNEKNAEFKEYGEKLKAELAQKKEELAKLEK